jgi:hypothetical protein
MRQIAIAFCGQVRGADLFRRALAPALSLRAQGRVQRILLSTWRGESDRFEDGAAALRALGVEIVESAFPERLAVPGNVFQQMLALDRALDQIDDDWLVLRTRPDVVFIEEDALASVLLQQLPPVLPPDGHPAVFAERVWVAYFLPATPFLAADQVFFGRASDLRSLCTYDLFTEAYQVTSRPNEQIPKNTSGAAAEIRRFLTPFLAAYPMLREYQFVWPKHAIGTKLLPEVALYNFRSRLYHEYLALWLDLVRRYFAVGGVPAASGKVRLVRAIEGGADAGFNLVNDDPLPPDLGARLALPQRGDHSSRVSFGAAWLAPAFAAPDADPLGALLLHEPLARAAAYRNDAARRQELADYLRGLWRIADNPEPALPFV